MQILSLTIVFLGLGVLLTSCQGENAVNKEEGLKLGALAPITGDLASIGRNLPTTVQLAVDAINECGGVNEAEVTLITEDSQPDPRAGSKAMTELVEDDGVAGVVGAVANSVSRAAIDIAVDKQVMMISPGSTSSDFTKGAKNNEFNGFWARTAPSDIFSRYQPWSVQDRNKVGHLDSGNSDLSPFVAGLRALSWPPV